MKTPASSAMRAGGAEIGDAAMLLPEKKKKKRTCSTKADLPLGVLGGLFPLCGLSPAQAERQRSVSQYGIT